MRACAHIHVLVVRRGCVRKGPSHVALCETEMMDNALKGIGSTSCVRRGKGKRSGRRGEGGGGLSHGEWSSTLCWGC